MNAVKAFIAVFQGFGFCLSKQQIRRLALWPWAIGALVYVAVAVGAVYSHSPLLGMLVSEPTGFISHVLYWLAWLLVSGLLLVGTLLLTVIIVMIFTGVFQTAIATETLKTIGAAVPEDESGVKATLKETGRTILTESAKLIWLVPLICLTFVIGLIPLMTPIALVMGAWLLAYQFVDVVLDVYRIKTRARISFGMRHGVLLVSFGLGLAACAIIPFVGLLIPPVATSGAAWFIHESGLLEATQENP